MRRDQHDAEQRWLALLDAIRHATGADSGAELRAATPDFNAPALVDRVLSESQPGELRVLRYLPTNLSQAEIASELAVAEHRQHA